MSERVSSLVASSVLGVCLLAGTGIGYDRVIAFFVFTAWFYHAYLFGKRLTAQTSTLQATLWGFLSLVACQSILLTLWYYLGGKLTLTTGALALCATLILFHLLTRKKHLQQEEDEEDPVIETAPQPSFWLWVPLSLIACASVTFVLYSAVAARTTEAIRTPWPLLLPGTLLALALAWSVCLILGLKRASKQTLITSLGVTLGITALAPLIYALGFGFDGFLHKASENIILQTGTLSPHPLSYIGQYVFTTFLTRLTALPLSFIDTWLVPLFSLFIPLVLFLNLKKRSATILPLSLLLIPWSVLVATTPQSFAYLLGFFAIATTLRRPSNHWLLPLSLATWSLATHPLAGAPFFAGTICLLLIERSERYQRQPLRSPILWLCVIGAILIVPVLFLILGQGANTIHWDLSALFQAKTYLALLPRFTPPTARLALWPDWAVFVEYATPLLTLLLALGACLKTAARRANWIILTLLGLGMILAGFILRTTGDFSFLVDYERSNYADRLFIMAQWFFLLPAGAMLANLVERAAQTFFIKKVILCVFFAGWFAAQGYLALPRHDATLVGHGWSVGRADLEAARFIERDAAGTPYTVLANQSTSAAAVSLLGFKRYTGDVFFYPIPTGGPLYQTYLRLTQEREPSLEEIKKASELGQTKLVYVVLNHYWWQAEKTGPLLQRMAEKTESIENGKIFIYRFDPSKAIKR